VGEDCCDGVQEIEGDELLVCTAAWPVDPLTLFVAVLKPISHLLKGSILEIIRKRGLAWAWYCAWEDEAAGVGGPG
jgi:hypothetical protein